MSDVTIETETFDFIDRVNAAVCVAEVQALLTRELGKHGFTQYIMLDVPPPRQRLESYTIVNGCTDDWFGHYTRECLHLHDPIARHMRTSIDPFYWDEVRVGREDRGEHRMMYDLSAFGLKQGLSIPFFGPSGDKSCIAMGGLYIDRNPRVLSALQIITTFAHARVRTLHAGGAYAGMPGGPSLLSEREREVLRWVANGKTDWEIGEILAISKETSFAHVRNCCRKLDAATRPQAVAKAIMTGEISVDS